MAKPIDYSKISDNTLELLANKKYEAIDYSTLPDSELEQVANYIDTYQATSKAQEPEDISKTESFLRGAAQGASFGFADELTAKTESLLSDKEYEQALAESREAYKAAEEANPMTSFAGNIAGGVAIPVPLLGAAATGATTAAKAGKLALAGAGMGAVAGVGTSEAEKLSADTAKEAASGAVAGALLTPAIGLGAPAVAKKAGEIVDSSRLGRSIKGAFTKAEEGQLEKAAEMAVAKATGASDEATKAIETKPRFGSAEYYKQQQLDLNKDTEKFIKDYINPKVSEGGVAGFRNKAYEQVALEAKKAKVSADVDQILAILKPGETTTKESAELLKSLSDDVLETVGARLEVDPTKLKSAEAIEKQKTKILDKVAVAQKKVEQDLVNKSRVEAIEAIKNLSQDKQAPVKMLADKWLEASRIKLQTRAANSARNESIDLINKIENPSLFADPKSPLSMLEQESMIKAEALELAGNILSRDVAEIKPRELSKELQETLTSKYVSSIDEQINSTYKLIPTQDPKTGNTVFVASFQGLGDELVSKPISVSKDLEPLIQGVLEPKEATKYTSKFANELLKEIKQGIKEAGDDIKLSIETNPETKSKIISATVPTSVPGKSQLITAAVPEGVEIPTLKVPAKKDLDFDDIKKILQYADEQLSSRDSLSAGSKEARKRLVELKDKLKSSIKSSSKAREAQEKADKIRTLESEELSRPFQMPISNLNRLRVLDKGAFDKTVQNEARALEQKLLKAGAKEASPEGSMLIQTKEALDKAAQMGMESAPTLKSRLDTLTEKSQELDILRSLYDREELPGGFGALVQRLGLSPTGAALRTSVEAGALSGKVQGKLRQSGVAQGINKLFTLDPATLNATADRVDNVVLKNYLKAMASADGAKKKALAFNLAQQPAMRDLVKDYLGVDFGSEEE